MITSKSTQQVGYLWQKSGDKGAGRVNRDHLSWSDISLGVILVILQEAALRSPKNIPSDGYPFRIKEGLPGAC